MQRSQNDQLRALAAAIAAGENPERFTALVKELNRLLDSDKQPIKEPHIPMARG